MHVGFSFNFQIPNIFCLQTPSQFQLGISGTQYQLVYNSFRQEGFKSILEIPVSGPNLPDSVLAISVEVQVGYVPFCKISFYLDIVQYPCSSFQFREMRYILMHFKNRMPFERCFFLQYCNMGEFISTIPHLQVAGRRFNEKLPPTPNRVFTFVWDGKDAYGRRVVGSPAVKGITASEHQKSWVLTD